MPFVIRWTFLAPCNQGFAGKPALVCAVLVNRPSRAAGWCVCYACGADTSFGLVLRCPPTPSWEAWDPRAEPRALSPALRLPLRPHSLPHRTPRLSIKSLSTAAARLPGAKERPLSCGGPVAVSTLKAGARVCYFSGDRQTHTHTSLHVDLASEPLCPGNLSVT